MSLLAVKKKLLMAQSRVPDYATAMAAITDKTLYARADTSSAADGANLASSNWLDEATGNGMPAVSVAGGEVWKTNVQAGKRGVFVPGTYQGVDAEMTLATLIGSGTRDCTLFIVEKRSGTQGPGTYTNSKSIGMDLWGLTFSPASRAFAMYTYGASEGYIALGPSFVDMTAYVLAVQVSSTGIVRANYNGTPYTPTGTLQLCADFASGIQLISNRGTPGDNYGLEYIVSSTRQSDSVVDNAVLALKAKWGIS